MTGKEKPTGETGVAIAELAAEVSELQDRVAKLELAVLALQFEKKTRPKE